MKLHILLFGIGVICAPKIAYTQEKEIEVEESAEVFLEEYSDDFQENFFEALKQKGIENYDKAINLLLECKRLKGNNLVIDHELAKAHLASKQYILAQEYALVIVNSEPENLWFLNTLVEILQKQGNSIDALKTQLPYDQNTFKENLALIYYGQRNYQKALKVLKEAKKTSFSEDLALKINDSLKRTVPAKEKSAAVIKEPKENPLDQYKLRIGEGIASNNLMEVSSLSKEALESFPSQPYFYYAYGWSLNKNGKSKLAVDALQNALDYLLDDDELANKIYKELAKGHTSLGNTSKANMYLSKIKPGS